MLRLCSKLLCVGVFCFPSFIYADTINVGESILQLKYETLVLQSRSYENNGTIGFTTSMLDGRTFYIVNENSMGGETCIIEVSFTSSTYSSIDWVYHGPTVWSQGCIEDYGTTQDESYSIENGAIYLAPESWSITLEDILIDQFIVTDPDTSNYPMYFYRDSVNNIVGG